MTDNTNTPTNDDTFTCSINFMSKDYPERGVHMSMSYSHDLTDRILEGGELPPAFAAAQDVANVLRMMQSEQSFNYSDEELAAMPEDKQDEAIREAAAQAIHTIRVQRLPRK